MSNRGDAPAVLIVRNARKNYGSVEALAGVSLTVHSGEIYGLLGPNGAGKSTLVSIVSGLLEPSSGEVFIGGESLFRAPGNAKRLLGVVPQEIAVYEELSAEENLRFFGSLYGLRGKALSDRVSEVLEWTGLTLWRNQTAARFSGGLKRRLNFAIGIVHRPRVLVLDEATAGVDLEGRLAIHGLIRRFAHSGGGVLMTTHYMEEAESMCDRVAIIDAGQILAEGTPQELVEKHAVRSLLKVTTPHTAQATALVQAAFPQCTILRSADSGVWISAEHGEAVLPKLLEALSESGIPVTEASIKSPGLEALFLMLTGKEWRNG